MVVDFKCKFLNHNTTYWSFCSILVATTLLIGGGLRCLTHCSSTYHSNMLCYGSRVPSPAELHNHERNKWLLHTIAHTFTILKHTTEIEAGGFEPRYTLRLPALRCQFQSG